MEVSAIQVLELPIELFRAEMIVCGLLLLFRLHFMNRRPRYQQTFGEEAPLRLLCASLASPAISTRPPSQAGQMYHLLKIVLKREVCMYELQLTYHFLMKREMIVCRLAVHKHPPPPYGVIDRGRAGWGPILSTVTPALSLSISFPGVTFTCSPATLCTGKLLLNQLNQTGKNIRKTWGIVNNVLGKKIASVDETIDKHLGKVFSEADIVENFAKTFVNDVNKVIHECDNRISKHARNNVASFSFYMPQAKASEILCIINSMNDKISPGFDKLRPKDLKRFANAHPEAITDLINKSLVEGNVPDLLKVSICRPIYKKGNHLDFANYRPVCEQSVCSKVIESFVAQKVINYAQKFNFINKYQYAYQRKKGTEILLEDFSSYINNELNRGCSVLCLFIDFSKAFDTINHRLLLQTLENIGIRGHALKCKSKIMLIKRPNTYVPCRISIRSHKYDCLHNNMFSCDCPHLEEVSAYQYLGVTVDAAFSWTPHIDVLNKKLKNITVAMYNLRCKLPFDVLKMVYVALAESIIRYGIGAWGAASETYINEIRDRQTIIIKSIMYFKSRSDFNENAFKDLNVLSVKGLYFQNIVNRYYFSNKYKEPCQQLN
ncbi:LINE-1 retrotransposable element ORF2 protein [Frankliniella fusca]|uniref:LINE-1 retrotransposable element ORF2 protein n=1 Tax=Frankliniella fusca TaxID=407009 RepID=A0AAE1HLK9_9NEOP|nr:LINE-1 retrotransposable element ORF2 protein [Frankliniella fusca]